MGTKSCAVWSRQSHNASDPLQSYIKLDMQDRFHGQPHGMYSADECFGGRNLNRGIELCAVVEQMYSLGIIYQVQGDPYFMDRLERIAFNAWPGTTTDDLWQHQYLQQANEINAMYDTNPHVWATDGADGASTDASSERRLNILATTCTCSVNMFLGRSVSLQIAANLFWFCACSPDAG